MKKQIIGEAMYDLYKHTPDGSSLDPKDILSTLEWVWNTAYSRGYDDSREVSKLS